MTYCTLDDILEKIPRENLIQLTDDEGIGDISQDRVNAAITEAGTVIDGFLTSRYTMPLSSVPPLINHLAVDLAIYSIYSRRFETTMPENMKDRQANAMKLLNQIQHGVVQLGVETPQSAPGDYKSNKTPLDRIFTQERLNKY